ncbi:MAG: hypothetical protein ACI8PZ_007359 [Myxococcota bacterium]|jgi:hypothetical protein
MSWFAIASMLACGGGEPAAPVTPAPAAATAPAPPPATGGGEAAAKAAMGALASTLKGRLIEQMQAGGPLAAVEVCGAEAQDHGARIAEETGVKVGRSSARLRNPKNLGPGWVQAWLEEHGESPLDSVEPMVTTATVGGAAVTRVLKPIPVDAPCLVCHGSPAQIPDPVKAYLAETYPQDEATGYAAGELRGVIWAEAPSG